MSSARYLEFDSTYRNRNLWPLAGEFEIPISQSGTKGPSDALDPVSLAASIKSWQSNYFIENGGGAQITLTVLSTSGLGAANDPFLVNANANPGDLQMMCDYYYGAVAEFSTSVRTRIAEYKYLGNDIGEFRFETAFNVVAGDTFTVSDPTDLSQPTDPFFFVPCGIIGANAYNNAILFNDTRGESRPIKDYDNVMRILLLDTSGSNVSTEISGPVTSWTVTDHYSIRYSIPFACGNLNGDIVNNPATFSSFNLPFSFNNLDLQGAFLEITNILSPTDISGALTGASSTIVNLSAVANIDDNFFNGCIIRMTSGAAVGQTSKIISYNGITKAARLSPGFDVSPAPGDLYLISCELEAKSVSKYVNISGNVTGSGVATSVNLPNNASNTQNDYNNIYITITSGAASGNIRLIREYNVNNVGGIITRTAIPYTPFSAPVLSGDSFQIISGIVSPPFSRSIGIQRFCLLQFSYDNFTPFTYSGSTVSQQEMVCYELELINLVLPNVDLAVGRGGRIAFYPYVYFEISNLSAASAGMKNVIYSNNPNSTKMVFRCAVDDIQNPLISTFVKIDGNGMIQTLKFKPNDNIKISVRLPSGEIYETTLEENYSPKFPNPLSQISGCISLKRL